MSIVSQTVRQRLAPMRGQTRTGITFSACQAAMVAVESALVMAASLLAGALTQLVAAGTTGNLAPYAVAGGVGGVAFAAAANRAGLFRLHGMLRFRWARGRVVTCWLWALLAVAILQAVLGDRSGVPAGAVLIFAAIGLGLLLPWRAAAGDWLHDAIDRSAICGRRAVLIGTEEELALRHHTDLLRHYGVDEIARFIAPKSVGGDLWCELGRTAANALERARDGHADEILLAVPWHDMAQMDFLRDRLRMSPLPVRLLPDRAVRSLLQYQAAGLERFPLIDIQQAPLTGVEQRLKRALDVVVAGTAILLLLPLLAMVAFLVCRETPGPALFRQRRKGLNGRQFIIYKFRTMTVMEDGSNVVQAGRSDKRITRFGRVLRKTSIDELPQLFNVLRGDMSLAGPRPHALAHDDEYGRMIANYAYRHLVKPGMTGWAQVNGHRGGTPRVEDMAKRIEHDLWYINNWSLVLDLKILLLTTFELVRPRNAY